MLPSSYNELKKLDKPQIAKIWAQLFGSEMPNFFTVPYRLIWHKIQARDCSAKIEQRHITRLNRYAEHPDESIDKSYKTNYVMRPGGVIVKTYKGNRHTVKIIDQNQFEYNCQTFGTLSAAAMAVCGKKVSGFDFFGMNNKGVSNGKN